MNDDTNAAIDGLCEKIIEQRDHIEALEAALRPFVRHYAEWMDNFPDASLHVYPPPHTYGELRAARAALDKGSRIEPGVNAA